MFKKVTGYKIINVDTKVGKTVFLEKAVNGLIGEGWTPKGSLVIDNDGPMYQIMVKHEQAS